MFMQALRGDLTESSSGGSLSYLAGVEFLWRVDTVTVDILALKEEEEEAQVDIVYGR